MKVILEILFLIFSNADIQFPKKKLTWRSYTTAEALPNIKQVELIDKKEFVKAALDENLKTFVIYVAILKAPLSGMIIHLSQEAQIAVLKQDEAPPRFQSNIQIFRMFFQKKRPWYCRSGPICISMPSN